MGKKIGTIILLSFCLVLTGCNSVEGNSGIEEEHQEIREQNREDTEVSALESTGQEDNSVENFNEEEAEEQDWENEMYDSMKSGGESDNWEEEMYDPMKTDEEADNWEEEMYDPMKTDGEADDWEEEMYDPMKTGEDMEEVIYRTEDYGVIEESGSEFYYEEDVKGYYYKIERFYLNSDFLYTMNDTLEKFYNEYLHQYQETENWYMEEGKQELPPGKIPHSELIFSGVQYVDNDYVSLLFLDIDDAGGAKPYHFYDAITLDRHTGEEVTAMEILNEDESEILEKVNELMGLDEKTGWNDLDFYLQEGKIVFFYRMSGFWEDVVLGR